MDYLHELPVTLISVDNIEADDTIAYMCRSIFNDTNRYNVTVMSSDRDFLQLVNDGCNVWSPTKKILYDTDKVFTEYELSPENYLTYRALTGDKSDNIPGIKGIGLKTLQKRFPVLFEQDKRVTVEDIINISSEKESTSNTYNSINANREQLRLNEQLMQLHNVDISEFAKNKISVQMNNERNHLSKSNFIRMLAEDRMTLVKDIIGWLNNFNYLESHN
jgi:DNA polymerase-1